MDRRSWPWKRKTSEKVSTTASTTATSLSSTGGNQGNQDNTKTIDYVQISEESYAHLTKLEDQVKVLNEKLLSAESEMTNKDNHVKQHAKVAEEAIAGWEKAEAESLALKRQLESVTLLKLTAEDRASHLDGALKECMKQVRNVKEESERKLHDTIFTKTKQWEMIKLELEAKISDFEEALLKSSAENEALSRSLQERSSLLMEINEEKSQAEAKIEVLKSDIQSREREINSLKYEVHVVSKELEIRNEEKNMSVRSADAANKQHIEAVKKITKLEAECQRLRGLVRKKLPGPAALAQMKLEVENLGRDYGETRVRRSPVKGSSPYLGTVPDFALEDVQQCHKENELLSARLLATEEETKMLKEALSKRNSELQAARNMCAKTISKLHSIEAHTQVGNQHKVPLKMNAEVLLEGSPGQNGSNPSLTSMSEDGIDEEGSCSESWATALMSELSQFRKGKDVDKNNKADNSKHLELMDDFLEMERLACLSTETDAIVTDADGARDEMKIEIFSDTPTPDVQISGKQQPPNLEQATKQVSCSEEQTDGEAKSRNNALLSKLQSRITSVLESKVLEVDMGNMLEDVRQIMQDTQEEFACYPAGSLNDAIHSTVTDCKQEHCPEDTVEAAECGTYLSQGANSSTETKHAVDETLRNAITQIHDSVVSLCKEVMEIHGRSDDHVLREKVELLSSSTNKILSDEINLDEFIINLSHMLSETRALRFNLSDDKNCEEENNSFDCIDKVTLLENSVAQHEPTKGVSLAECPLPSPASYPENFNGPTSPGFEPMPILQKCSIGELEQMKMLKDHMELDLARCTETLEHTKLQLAETEQHLAEVKSQLAACQKSNSLADTQLKCMAESYNSLETRAQELETEINLLRSKAEALDNELQEERHIRQDDLAKYKELQEQATREVRCSMCSFHSNADNKTKQEQEIAMAAEKLAECQESIFLLGRQLKALQPPIELAASSQSDRHHVDDDFLEDEQSLSGYDPTSILNTQEFNKTSIEDDAPSVVQLTGGDESPLDGGNSSHFSPSDLESSSTVPRVVNSSKRQKNRSRSASSSSLSSMLNEKHGRGFSRFFTKGKSDHY